MNSRIIPGIKILAASALLFVTASAQALEPELLYGFQLGPQNPAASLIQGSDGNFYGTTYAGGSGACIDGCGTVFKVTTDAMLTTLASFTGTNGSEPMAGLVLGGDGNFYGTTSGVGSGGAGTVFQVTTNGVLTTLVSFTGANGLGPVAGLVLGRDGNFYGTTSYGGPGGGGTIFRLIMPKFTSMASLPGGTILLTGAGPANEGCRLWACKYVSLPFASWALVTSNAFDTNSTFSYTDAGAASNVSRFYRLTVP